MIHCNTQPSSSHYPIIGFQHTARIVRNKNRKQSFGRIAFADLGRMRYTPT